MSKITQALEKAARERRLQQQEQATVPDTRVAVAVAAPDAGTAAPAALPESQVYDVAPQQQLHIDPHIVSMTDAKSPIAEQYRVLKTNLQSLRFGSGASTIVITSALHGEGKSVTSLNLALTLARQEQLKVVLVDADLRRSSINRWLGMEESRKGLSTVLQRGGVFNGSFVRVQSPALTILPAGPIPDDPAGLLDSTNMKRVLASLKTQFDVILIDTPPVLSVADAGILAAQVDGVLFVVRAGKTQARTVSHAKTRLEQMRGKLIGCLLTQVAQSPGYGYYHYYSKPQQDQAPDGTPAPDAVH